MPDRTRTGALAVNFLRSEDSVAESQRRAAALAAEERERLAMLAAQEAG